MEMCDLGENSPPFVSMPLAAMRKAVDYLSGERERTVRDWCAQHGTDRAFLSSDFESIDTPRPQAAAPVGTPLRDLVSAGLT